MIEKKNNNKEDDENNITIKSIVSMYGNRMNRYNWYDENLYEKTLSELENMNLRDFCANFRIGL